MSEQSRELLERIRRRLHQAARRITLADLLFGSILTLGITSALWLLSTAVEAGFWLGTDARTLLFWAVAAAIVALSIYYLAVPLLRLVGMLPGPTPDHVAQAIGSRFPEIGDRLTNLLDLSEGRRSYAPDALVDGAVQMLGRDVDPVSFESVADFSRARRAVRLAVLPLASLLLFLAAAPGTFYHASQRLLSPGTHFDQPAPFRLQIEPGSVEVARGSGLEISVQAVGRDIPQRMELALNNLDEDHVETVRLTADSSGAFRHQLANVRRSFRYRIHAAPVASPWYEATVAEYPLVRGLQVTLDFPGYSGVPSQRLEPNVGDVTGLPGTEVALDVALGGPETASARVRFDDGSTLPLHVDGDRASGSFVLDREGSYQIVLENEGGLVNRDPIPYGMTLVVDAEPSVSILQPEADVALDESLQRLLETHISDDYGFYDLTLFYRLAESRFGQTSETFDRIALPLEDPRGLDQEIVYDWRIGESTPLDPVPGDVIEYFVRVRDNDAFAGYKASESAVQRLRFPSLAEQYERLSEEQDAAESQLEGMIDEGRQLEEQFDALRDEIRRKQDTDWEDERQLEQLQERQRSMEEQVDDLSRQVESMNRSARQNDLLGEETLEMYQEMQHVIEEINSPEMREALEQLQQAMEALDLSQMQEAVENFEFSEDEYRQRLERTLELFKNLRAQQSLEEAARRAEELARQEEQLAERTAELMQRGDDEGAAPTQSDSREASPENEDPEDGDPAGASDSEESGEEETGREESGRDAQQEGSETERGAQEPSDEGASPQNPSDHNPSEEAPNEQDQAGGTDTEREPASEQLARQQELSRQEMARLEELLQEAQDQIASLQKGPASEMQQLNESLREQQMQQRMQENAEQLRSEEFQEAQSGQQHMQDQLQQLQQQLSQMQSGMQGTQMEVNLAGLRRALGDVLTLSQGQETLRRRLRSNVSEAPSLREDAREQVELSEGLSTVIDSLRALSENIPEMSREVQRLSGQALREMGAATESMTERSAAEASGYQTAAMMNLNELALLLSDVLDQLMNQSGSGSGQGNMQQMIQQMQQMAQQQQQLNQQIQEFLNDMQGNRLSTDMQQRLQQMGSQQQAIKRQLDEMRRNPDARGNLLGDLDRIAEQMEETIYELQRRQIEPRTIERQQQILQRLLDAQRSLNERGQDRRREAQEGEDVVRESPADLPPEEAADKLRRDLIRALESGYAPDYEDLIKRYFELLQQQQAIDKE
jgi:hypothetical protein